MVIIMGIKDRSPLTGDSGAGNPGTHRSASQSKAKAEGFFSSAWTRAALTLTALLICASVVLTVIAASTDNSVHAADIADVCIGSAPIGDGVGRTSSTGTEAPVPDSPVTEETETTETTEATEESAPVTEDGSAPVDTDDVTDTDSVTEEAPLRFTVTFELYGRDSISVSVDSPATVAELAEIAGVVFAENDTPSVPLDTVISADTTVATDNVVYSVITVSTPISYQTVYKDDPTLLRGEYVTETQGVNGTSVTEYEVKYVNGAEVSRTELGTTVTPAVDEVIRKGTKVVTNEPTDTDRLDFSNDSTTGGSFVGKDGKTYTYTTYIDVWATCYYTGGICASGHVADETVIAVDPTVIPLGTEVYIAGEYAEVGYRTAEDTGGGIKGYTIDVCLDPNNPITYNFGWRPMRVYILA